MRSPRQATHPHAGHAGFVHGATHATAYLAEPQGMDDEGGKYAVVCEHNNIVNVTSKRDARLCAIYPGNFCSDCYKRDALR